MKSGIRSLRFGLAASLFLFTATIHVPAHAGGDDRFSLAGPWSFRLDPGKKGLDEKWFSAALPDKCKLPGSTDENGYGLKNTRKPDFNYLARAVEYAGPAWYQEIEVPAAWKGKRVTLFLERCHWETQAWLDDRHLGMQDSLCVPHVYDLGDSAGRDQPGTVPPGLAPGKHRLTIRVDNAIKYNVGKDAHSITEQTQTNWNGIVGRIELRATDPVWIEDVQVYPDPDRKTASVRVAIGNATGKPVAGQLVLTAVNRKHGPAPRRIKLNIPAGKRAEETVVMSMGEGALPWDEFSPSLYDLKVSLTATHGARDRLEKATAPRRPGDSSLFETEYADQRKLTFGMRKLGVSGKKQFTVNGRTIFLRGTLECCIFPLTGYPPTDVDSWLRILKVAKSYGLNHLRFHSWCPPEAAFVAADQLGFLFHVEAPQWVFDVGKDPPRDQFIELEVRRILDAYGNHPSFGMLCMGNELGGDAKFLSKLVKLGQQRDPRRLYTSSTAWSLAPENDYCVAVVRGLGGPATDHDFRRSDAGFKVPVISHEIGQWTVFPNLEETKKYTGVLRPRNFELVREGLAAHHLLDQAADFTRASGLLMVSLYKEEIEVLLRTPGHAGFQLLDLHDFPGQGTALVGTLDPFWDSKGLIAPEAWRRFCGPSVPLLRMKKRTYTADETFTAQAEIAHFGPRPIDDAVPVWSIRDQQGKELARGELPKVKLPAGSSVPLGELSVPLSLRQRAEVRGNAEETRQPAAPSTSPSSPGAVGSTVAPRGRGGLVTPAELTVTVGIKGTEISNSWDIWVYPAAVDTASPKDVLFSHSWDEAKAALAEGRKVLLAAPPEILAQSLPGSFTPVFWSPVWFPGQGAGTMGILCDPKHPALARFPTEFHTNWQWYDLLQNSRTMILDDTPADFRPVVQVIDNFVRNHKLGNVLEARVGKGRLLLTSISLRGDLGKRPAARQFLASLLAYAGSGAFQPKHELDLAVLEKMFRRPLERAELPKDLSKVVLDVKAAVKVPSPEVPRPWDATADEVSAKKSGFGYAVRGSTWRDATGSAWHDQQDLRVTIACPKGFQGKLYAHFHDWNNLDRVAEVSFQGRAVGTLADYNGPGAWLALPVTSEGSASGKLELSARPTRANVMITRIVVVAAP